MFISLSWPEGAMGGIRRCGFLCALPELDKSMKCTSASKGKLTVNCEITASSMPMEKLMREPRTEEESVLRASAARVARSRPLVRR